MNVFNLIYGVSGTGKSEYLYKDIEKKIDKFENIYIIVPEQSVLITEKNLFKVTNKTSFLNVEILTFNKLAYKIFEELDIKIECLSKISKSMIIYDLLVKNKENLKFLGKSDKNIETVDKILTEFKMYNITPEVLENTEIFDKYTSLKVDDIILLYNEYQKRIGDLYFDENDILSILAKNISKSNIFDNAAIYFDDFLDFTPQQYCVFQELIKKSNEINFSICIDELESSKKMENDIFYFNRIFANKILSIVDKQKLNENFIKLEKNFRLKNEELQILENVLIGKNIVFDEQTKNIKLFLANNMNSEIDYLAKTIYDLVKNYDYKYKDIGIITSEESEYSETVFAVFNNYNIPVRISLKKDLDKNILVKYILSLLNIFSEDWSYESVFKHLKIGLSDYEYSDVCLLENYCVKWGIKGEKWFENEFRYEQVNEIQDNLEKIRKDFTGKLLKLKDKFYSNLTIKDLVNEIYVFLDENKIIDKLNNMLTRKNDINICNEYSESYKIIIQTLKEMSDLFGDEQATFDRFKDLFEVGISTSGIKKGQEFQDQVILGSIDKVRNNDIKILFVLGFNDGKFPKVDVQEGYLNDIDRQILQQSGIQLAKTSLESMYEGQFEVYKMLVLPEEKLYVSYCSSDKEGKTIRPSIILKKLTRTFKKIEFKSDVLEKNYSITSEKATFEEALELYKNYLDSGKIDEKWNDVILYFYNNNNKEFEKVLQGANYSNIAERIGQNSIKKLYGDKFITTITRLESFKRCPFAYHITYGLKLNKKDNYEMTSIDTGSFMHQIIDEFFSYIEKNDIDIKMISHDEICDIVNLLSDEILSTSRYYIFQSSAKFKIKTQRLKKVVLESLEYIVYSLKYSDFKPYGHEVSFGEDGKYSPIEFLSSNGNKIEITGKIDRIDVAKLDDKKYVRIIDYKSQSKNVDLKQVEMGLQIQLLTYLDALTEKDEFDPAGILYFGLIDNIVRDKKNLDDEEIKQKLKNNFKMKGLLLSDINIIKMMDNKLIAGSSDIVPAYISKDGTLSKKRSSIIEKDEFDNLQEMVKKIIKETSEDILNGNIDIKPFKYKKKTGCEFCEYKSICGYRN